MKSLTRQRRSKPSHRGLFASFTVILSFVSFVWTASAQTSGSGDHWVTTWATATVSRLPVPAQGGGGRGQAPQGQAAQGQAPQGQAAQGQAAQGQPPAAPQPPLNINNQTLRQIVRVSVGGERLRVVFTNNFGSAPLTIGAASVAIRDKQSAIAYRSDRPLTFGGSSTVSIPTGATLVSDPVNLMIPAQSDLAIDIYLPGDTASGPSPLTIHTTGLQTNYVSPQGNYVRLGDIPAEKTTQNWFFLSRVDVTASAQTGAIVTLGDSITDGTRSTPDTNNRWPDHLARRLTAQNIKMGVINSGIAGNRVMTDGAGVSALARLDRDLLVHPGVTHLIVLEGINDLRGNPAATAADVIFGHQQIIERARARGLKVYGATLTPCGGSNGWTAEREEQRLAFNEWMRTSKAYDGVIDFDQLTRDPENPDKFLPKFDSGDHLHPNDAGYQAMAGAINLDWFGIPVLQTTR
jgi:lysophospholipase L1-like esterase